MPHRARLLHDVAVELMLCYADMRSFVVQTGTVWRAQVQDGEPERLVLLIERPHRDWVAADPSKEAWCRQKLQEAAENPPRLTFMDSESAIGDKHWDAFAAECGALLLAENADDPLGRLLVAIGVTSYRYATSALTMKRAFERRDALGDDFDRLLSLALRWSGVRSLRVRAALLAGPNKLTAQGRRDHALLLFLYNSGARADEAAHVLIGDLQLGLKPKRDPSSVLIRGKGNKQRRCPLWPRTVNELAVLMPGRAEKDHVFVNRRGEPLTRFGVHAMVERYAARVAEKMPSIATKRVSPHTIRHTTATHLLRSGVDINTIRAWLGHVSLETTNVYAEVDLEMKAKALANCEVKDDEPKKPWRRDKGLMEFLRTL